MYTIYKNTIRRTERLNDEQLGSCEGRYATSEEAHQALLKIRAMNGDPKAIRELCEAARFAEWLKERDALVNAIIAECNRLERDIPAAAYALGSTDLKELSNILENLKSK